MFEILKFEARHRRRGTFVVTALLVGYLAFVVGLFPSIETAGVDFDAYLESLPPAVKAAFARGVPSLLSAEGYLVSQFYQLGWVLLLGMYVAYSASKLVIGDVERKSLDILLAAPVSRRRVALEKFLSLVPTILVVNAVMPIAAYVGMSLIGAPVLAADIALLHAASILYLLACGALGFVLSVTVSKADTARTGALGLVFGLYMLDTLTTATEYEWVGALSPTRHYLPGEVLINGTIDWWGQGALLAMTVVLVAVSVWWFERRDVPG